MTPAVQLAGVRKAFGAHPVLHDVSLRVERGERVALLGESGSGKSTLLNLVAGLESPDAGIVRVLGHEMSALDADGRARVRREHIGFVFQAFHLLAHLSAVQNVAVPLLLAGERADVAQQRAAHWLDDLGLGERLHALPRELSGGEQQRVALARALVHEPQLVLADEPTGNLDPANAQRALEGIASTIERCGAALVLVTHSEQAARIAQRRVRLLRHTLEEEPAAAPAATPGSTPP
ncbi:MAG: ABC transporter ATP-binding protein [Burkholderiales bacterium]|nr:MAG: ABC transporter ATP-binding protein [Burkholderiales bacterium]